MRLCGPGYVKVSCVLENIPGNLPEDAWKRSVPAQSWERTGEAQGTRQLDSTVKTSVKHQHIMKVLLSDYYLDTPGNKGSGPKRISHAARLPRACPGLGELGLVAGRVERLWAALLPRSDVRSRFHPGEAVKKTFSDLSKYEIIYQNLQFVMKLSRLPLFRPKFRSEFLHVLPSD